MVLMMYFCVFMLYIYLQVLEVHDPVRPVLVRGPRKPQRRLELAVASHGVDQALVEVSKYSGIVLNVYRRFQSNGRGAM